MKAVRMRNGGPARGTRAGVGEVIYPESDRRPMAETDEHIDQITYLREAMKIRFSHQNRVYVAGNNLLYYVEGDPRKCVSPDVYVVKGVENRVRRTYKLWEEKKAPCVAIEVSSKSTSREDLVTKFRVYRDVLRVKEYYIYDLLREYLPGRMKAWWLVRGEYLEQQVDGDRVLSRELGLALVDTGKMLRLADPKTGEELRTHAEEAEARKSAEAERDALRAKLDRMGRAR